MADVGIGALGYFGYAKETTSGTSIAPQKFLPATSINFNDSNDYLNPLTIRGTRDSAVALPAPYIVQGTVEMPLVSDDIALLLKSAFNANVSTSAYTNGSATTAYLHAYTLSDSITSNYTMSVETATPGNLLVNRYVGVRVNTLELRAAFGEIVTATVGFDGIDRVAPSASGASPTYAANSVSPFHFNGVTVGTVSSVQNFTFGINNNIEHIGVLAATRAYNRVALGQREITLTMTCDFQDNTSYLAMFNDSEVANITLTFVGPGIGGSAKASLQWTVARAKYKTIGVPINATDFVTQDIEFTVLRPTAVANQIITGLQLVNQEWLNLAGTPTAPYSW